jgi:hypothetical protein
VRQAGRCGFQGTEQAASAAVSTRIKKSDLRRIMAQIMRKEWLTPRRDV